LELGKSTRRSSGRGSKRRVCADVVGFKIDRQYLEGHHSGKKGRVLCLEKGSSSGLSAGEKRGRELPFVSRLELRKD